MSRTCLVGRVIPILLYAADISDFSHSERTSKWPVIPNQTTILKMVFHLSELTKIDISKLLKLLKVPDILIS